MSCSTINIAASPNPLPECSPNLMPFHLNYSGTAPITTYFRVKPATLRDESGKNVAQLSPETLSETNKEGSDRVAVATTSDHGAGDDTGPAMVVSPSAQPVANANTQTQKKLSLGARFVAAFRGRTVHGVTVDLPEGYSGIVLRAEEDGRKGKAVVGRQSQEAAPKAKKGRSTRKASRTDVDEDIDMERPPQEEDRECRATRTLNPTAIFSSFVLWNPDLPVDEAKDEYLRSLTEWTQLAEEASLSFYVRYCMLTLLDVMLKIHRFED